MATERDDRIKLALALVDQVDLLVNRPTEVRNIEAEQAKARSMMRRILRQTQ